MVEDAKKLNLLHPFPNNNNKVDMMADPLVDAAVYEHRRAILTAEEMVDMEGAPKPLRPHMLCVAPTRELLKQNHEILQRYTAGTPVVCQVMTGGDGDQDQYDVARSGCDILSATCGVLRKLVKTRAEEARILRRP